MVFGSAICKIFSVFGRFVGTSTLQAVVDNCLLNCHFIYRKGGVFYCGIYFDFVSPLHAAGVFFSTLPFKSKFY